MQILVLVEAELQERAYPASALRRAVDDRVVDRIAEQARRRRQQLRTAVVRGALAATLTVADAVAIPGVASIAVAQVRDEVARRREADAGDDRILGGVDELVDVVGIEAALRAHLQRAWGTRKRSRCTVPKRPGRIWNQYFRVELMHAHRQRCVAVVRAHSLVRRRRRQVLRRPRRRENVFGADASGDCAAILVTRDDRPDLDSR